MKKISRAQVIGTLLAISAFSISVAFNACSEVQFAEAPTPAITDDPSVSPSGAGGLVINNGDLYTNDTNVLLSIDSGGHDEMFLSTSSDCSTGQWEPSQASTSWVLDQENVVGAVYVKFRSGDSDVDSATCFSDDILHDNIPPGVVFGDPQDQWHNIADVDVMFVASDMGSGLDEVKCGKSPGFDFKSCLDKWSGAGLIEGSHALIVRMTDKAGNLGLPVGLRWGVDMTPPEVVINSQPSSLTNQTTGTFQFTAKDAVSGIKSTQCQMDDAGYEDCTDTFSKSNLASGPHTFNVKTMDLAGNESPVVSYTFTVDADAPTVTITSHPDPLTNSMDAAFEFEGSDNGVAINDFMCQLDNAAYEDCDSPKNYANVADGVHTFRVKGMDGAGNFSAEATYSWEVDATKPTISFVQTPPAISTSTTANFQFNATDSGSGIDMIECKIDAGAYQNCGNAIQFDNLAAGSHQVMARAKDNAGNLSDPISYSWVIDNQAPTVQITKTPGPFTSDNFAEFEFTADDGGGSGIDYIECQKNGEAGYSLCSSPKLYTNVGEGTHVFTVRARDKAGLYSAPEAYTWAVDATGPTIIFDTYPMDPFVAGGQASVLFQVLDSVSGVESVSCQYDGADIACEAGSELSLGVQALGSHSFTVTAVDKVGNMATATKTWNAVLDFVAKSASVSVSDDKPVDILFVVDNSGSMNYELSSINNRINGFIDKIQDLNWQIGVISTSVATNEAGTDGRLLPLRNSEGYVLKPDTADAQTVLGTTIKDQIKTVNRSGLEQGIYGTYRFVERTNDDSNPGENSNNQDLIRDGADFVVVLFSDEKESVYGNRASAGSNIHTNPNAKNEPTDLFNLVKDLWSEKNFTFHSIITIPGDQVCLAGEGYSYGPRYEALSQMTDGVVGSVCATDYATQLQDIGQSVKDMQKTVSLECEPGDQDGDGTPDIVVEMKDAAGDYQPYGGSYQIQATKLAFDDYLPPGDFRVNYYCVN